MMSRRVQNRFALTLLLVFVFLLAACGTVGQLKGILEAVEANEPRAQGTRYGANYNRLRMDVSGARQAVPGCN